MESRVIEATELTIQRKATDAMLAIQGALLELTQLRGEPPQTRLVIASSKILFRAPVELDVLLAMARTNNFELRVRAAELAQQGFRLDLAQNER